MKKAIGILLAMLMVLPSAFASIDMYGNRNNAVGKAAVGEFGYLHADNSNKPAEVFVCATKSGKVKMYGLNLLTREQKAEAEEAVRMLSKSSFAQFDHYGCLR